MRFFVRNVHKLCWASAICVGLVGFAAAQGSSQTDSGQSTALPDGVSSDAATIVDLRRSVMQAMDNNLAIMEAAGTDAGMLDAIVDGGDIVALLGVSLLLYPPNTDPSSDPDLDTTASPDIWTNWEAFESDLIAATDLANMLASATTGETIAANVGSLRAACTSCHEAYVNYQ